MKNNFINFIAESVKKGKKNQKEYSFGNGYVFVKDPLPNNVDLNYVLETIEDVIPPIMRMGVESIVVGDLEEFKDREINAFFKDGAVYITNDQTDNDDMIDDIIHEIAHSVEETHGYELYALDTKIADEFRTKRKKLRYLLNSQGINTQGYNFEDIEYNSEFDDYLYQSVGYPILEPLSLGVFPNAYAITSVREYFASGFELYFMGDEKYLKQVSPSLYQKIKEILKND